MKRLIVILLLLFCVSVLAQDTNYYTPAQYLSLQQKPVWKSNTAFKKVGTWWGVPPSANLALELASNWDCYLTFNGYKGDFGSLSNAVATSSNVEAIELGAAMANTNLQLQVYIPQVFDTTWTNIDATNGWTFDPGQLFSTNSSGQFIGKNGTNYATWFGHGLGWSPAASDSMMSNIVKYQTRNAPYLLASNITIGAVVLDSEYGLDTLGNAQSQFNVDVNALAAKGSTNWIPYWNLQYAREFHWLYWAATNSFPNRNLFSFYKTGYETSLFQQAGYDWENSFAIWGAFDTNILNVPNTVSDWPSPELYYATYWTNGTYLNWSTQNGSEYRNWDTSLAFNYAHGITNLSTPWINGGTASTTNGWNHLSDCYSSSVITNPPSVLTNYMGALKCMYVRGAIGSIMDIESLPSVTDSGTGPTILGSWGIPTSDYGYAAAGSFPTNIVPHWMAQIVAATRVHSAMTWLDTNIMNSALLPGDLKDYKSYYQSYSFTNNLNDTNIFTYARQNYIGNTNQWIIAAWGPERASAINYTANIPTLGTVTLTARPEGAVYVATPTTLTLMDTNGTVGVSQSVSNTVWAMSQPVGAQTYLWITK